LTTVNVFYNPLDANSKESFPIECGTQIIDFLRKEFPLGFEGCLRVFVGNEEISLDDLDYEVGEDEQITMLVMPSAEGVGYYIGQAIVTALIATAIGFVINLIFPPKVPGSAKNESESPVYSLNANTNASRLGDPIPTHYGTVSFPPDLASAPYFFFNGDTNDQYVDTLLVVGHGFYNINEIYVGDTPLTSLERGTAEYWVFNPLEHTQRMGIVTNLIAGRLAGTDNPIPFRENVFTSPEVENIEQPYNQEDRDESSSGAIAGIAYAAGYDSVAKKDLPGRIAKLDNTLDIRTGDWITISGTASNNGLFHIGSISPDPFNASLMTIFEATDSTAKFANENPVNGTFTLTKNTNILSAGPFRAQKPGQQCTQIEVDIVFYQGLYRIDGNTGKVKTGGPVAMRVSCQKIDDDGNFIGAPVEVTRTYEAKTRVAYRDTIRIPVPQGPYEVTVTRVTPINDDTRRHEIVSWAQLRGVLAMNGQVPAYGPVTLMAVRLKASRGLGSSARSRIRISATRVLWGESVFDPRNSWNPMTVIKDIWTNPDYGMNRPLNELDTDVINATEEYWDTLKGGPTFNGSFDSRSTGFDAMQSVASSTGCKIIQVGGLTSIAQERKQLLRTAMFTSANIVKDSLQIQYAFDTDGDYDGIQIEYRDPESFQPAYVLSPDDSAFPDTYTLFGCTDRTYAKRYANYLNNMKLLRRKSVTFQTELDGLIPRIGDRFAISSPMPNWGVSGAVTDILSATSVRVDRMLPWSKTEENYMLLRSETGEPWGNYLVTKGASDNIVIFDVTPDITLYDSQGREPTFYAFGTQDKIVSDFVLSKVSPKSETTIEIEGQTYSTDIYVGGPPHMLPPNEIILDTTVRSLSSVSSVSTPSLDPDKHLLAKDLQSVSLVTTADLSGEHILLADNLQATSQVTRPSVIEQ